jgi:alkylhydroperoxidase/carboxymuconolactone decarboxylase family protein YurZ
MQGSRITDAGRQTALEMFGPKGPDICEANAQRWTQRVDESWSELITGFVVNGMYSRNVLGTGIRELCAVAALTVLGRAEELETHLRAALRTNPVEHVREVVIQMSVYGGFPVALSGMRLLEKILAEGGEAAGPA